MQISGRTRVFGVIGDPLEHTLSPAIQNAAFQHLGLDCVFLAFHVKSMEVEKAMAGVRGLGIGGLNVTMPHKNAVIPYLDEVDEAAKFLGSVNTIVNRDGRLRGFSTDGAGALNALKANGADPHGKKVVVLGAGGAAKAIAYALAPEAEELTLLNRTPQKTHELTKALYMKFIGKINSGSLSTSDLWKNLQDADILINATSVGMHPNADESIVQAKWLKLGLTVMDIVYNPVETKLAANAKAAGAKVVSGVEMLVYQGAASFEIWIGKKAPVEVMRQAALNQLGGKTV
jgi:shikimate dehydrogenase